MTPQVDFLDRARSVLSEWMPYISVPLVTFIIAEIKRLKPKWKTRYRRHWPLVAVFIGVLLNLFGISIKPADLEQLVYPTTSGPVDVEVSDSPFLTVAKVVGIGIMAGLAGKGARDWNKERIKREAQEERAGVVERRRTRRRRKGGV